MNPIIPQVTTETAKALGYNPHEATFLGIGSTCWNSGIELAGQIFAVVLMTLIVVVIIYGIYSNIKKSIEHRQYMKDNGYPQRGNITLEEIKDNGIKLLKNIGIAIGIGLIIFIYFLIVTAILKLMGKC